MAIQKRPSVLPKNSSEWSLSEDDVLRRVYASRDTYAAEHNHDLDRIYADLKGREAKSCLRRVGSVPARA
jgi:hypothetical protein